MKYTRFIIGIGIFLFCIHPTVSAHTLKIDGSMGVTVHIDPNDEPVEKIESKIFVDISDKSRRFDPKNPGTCECSLIVEQKGKTPETLPIVAGGVYTQLTYTFPTAGSYRLLVTGKPINGGTFAPFRTQYDYYVHGNISAIEPMTDNPLQRLFPYIVAFAGSIIVLLFVFAK